MRNTIEMTLEEIKELDNEVLTIDEVLDLECNEHFCCIETLGISGINNCYWYVVRLEDDTSIDVYVKQDADVL